LSIVIVPKNHRLGEGFTRAQRMAGNEHPGRRRDGSQSAPSWIVDLVSLKKTILLCSFHRQNFDPRKHHYRKLYVPDHTGSTDGYQVNGKCDDCGGFTVNLGGGTAFIHEEIYSLTCIDPVVARRNARAKAYARPAWRY